MAIRVCHILSGDLWAGAEVMAFHLIRGLQARTDIEPFAIVLNLGRLAEELDQAGVPTLVLNENKLTFRDIARSTADAVGKWLPQILHSHRYKENALAFLVSRTAKKRPILVGTQHGMPEVFDSGARLKHRLKARANFWLMAHRFDMTVAVSTQIQQSLKSRGFRDGRIRTILNGMELPEPDRHAPPGPGFAIGSAGRLVPVKDYFLMAEIAWRMREFGPDIRFELAGDGPLFDDLRSRITNRGLADRFVLKGMVRDILGFYRGLDVYLNTSVHEGIPMSVLEAMALGIPPVVPRVGGLPEMITDGVEGFLVDGRDPEPFVRRCLELFRDCGLRRRMGLAARQRVVERFSVARMVDGYMDVYRQLMEQCAWPK